MSSSNLRSIKSNLGSALVRTASAEAAAQWYQIRKNPPKIRFKKIREIKRSYLLNACNSLTNFENEDEWNDRKRKSDVNLNLKFAWRKTREITSWWGELIFGGFLTIWKPLCPVVVHIVVHQWRPLRIGTLIRTLGERNESRIQWRTK